MKAAPQVVIAGGGISGLAAAYFLEKQARQAGIELSIHLVEERDRLGGVILTERAGGFLVEGGPDSFLAQKPAAIELCRELGLADQLLPSNDHLRKTYVWQGGKLKELPDGMMFVVPTRIWPIFHNDLFSFSGKFRMALSSLRTSRNQETDVSVADYVRQRLGVQVLERLAEPMLAAVYGGDVNTLSARAVLPQLVALEDKYGSLWRGMREVRRQRANNGDARAKSSLFVTLRDGVGQLTAALEKRFTQTSVRTRQEILKIGKIGPLGFLGRVGRLGQSGFLVESKEGGIEADAVILATPAHAAARLTRELDPRLADKLGGIPYHSSVIVTLGFDEDEVGRELNGFGFLVPRSERKEMIACTWVNTKFSYRSAPGKSLLRCFLGGARNPSVMQMSDDALLDLTLRELAEIMGLRAKPQFVHIFRWEKCMPQYAVGHLRLLEEISAVVSEHPGLFLAGNGYRGIGIPDCIQSGAAAAAGAIQYLQSRLY
ncbi:MAG: protoporphyrinogen oxidase [Acidobacteria bacterium]|nr:protoporphyrinogen oxidase [Acidobacteriota bacterium]